jgi:hypothetical protein
MTKQNGLGARLFVGGYNLSGDTQSVGSIAGPVSPIDVTGIDKQAYERIGGRRDGRMAWTSFFNPDGAHPVLSALPRTDIVTSYFAGTTIGNPAASQVAKQVGYDVTRPIDGAITIGIEAQSNGYGLAWGVMLTAGERTDTAATDGATLDQAAATSFGWTMFVHLTSLTGTDIEIKVQDSANGSTWADLAGATTGALTTEGSARVAATTTTATARRYVRAVTTTTGGFTSATFAVMFVKPPVAVA